MSAMTAWQARGDPDGPHLRGSRRRSVLLPGPWAAAGLLLVSVTCDAFGLEEPERIALDFISSQFEPGHALPKSFYIPEDDPW